MNDKEKDEYIAQLESIIAMMPGLVYWKGKDGKYLGCNNNEVKIFKLKSRDEFIGKTTEELVGAKLSPALLANDYYVLNTGNEFCGEEIGISLNEEGEGIYLTTKSPLKNTEGEITGIVGISMDITERKKIEEKLKKTQAELLETSTRLEEILTLIPGHIYWKDTAGRYLGCNEAFARTLNLTSHKAIIGKSDSDLIAPHLSKAVVDLDAEVIKNNIEKTVEELAIDKNGNPAIYLSKKAPLKNAAGETIGLVGVSFDITERKQAEEELNKTKQKLETIAKEKTNFIKSMSYIDNIISLIPGNVYWKDRQGRYLGCNENIAKLANLKNRQEIIGKTLHDIFEKNLADKISEIDNNVMQSAKTVIIEEDAIDADGNQATYFTQKIPLFDEEKNVIGMLGISLDITERKKFEKELQQAKEQAEAASRAKSEFLAMISHELRIPLTGILGMAQLMQYDENLPLEHQEEITDIIKSGEHLLELVNDLLDISKLEAGKVELQAIIFNLKQLIHDATAIFIPKIQQKNLSLKIFYDKTTPELVIGDARLIKHILLNLISNAVKFTNEGHIHIKINVIEKHATQASIEIAIEDTGIGILADKLETIFEKFSQADSSITRKYGGTGLGLSIVKAYLELMQGSITVESQPGKGSVFSCKFKLQLASEHRIRMDFN